MPVIGKERIDGKVYEISVDGESGKFYAEINGHTERADTKTALVEILRKKARRAKVRLALSATLIGTEVTKDRYGNGITTKDGIGVHRVTITGLHSQNKDVLLKFDDLGRVHRYSGRSWHGNGILCRRLTEVEEQRYLELHQAKDAAEHAFTAFIEEVEIANPEQWVAEEITKREGETPPASAEPAEEEIAVPEDPEEEE